MNHSTLPSPGDHIFATWALTDLNGMEANVPFNALVLNSTTDASALPKVLGSALIRYNESEYFDSVSHAVQLLQSNELFITYSLETFSSDPLPWSFGTHKRGNTTRAI